MTSKRRDRAGEVLEAALELTPKQRRAMAAILMHSVPEPGVAQADVDASWDDEIQRRLDDIDSGRVKMIPAAEVFRQMRSRLRRRAPR